MSRRLALLAFFALLALARGAAAQSTEKLVEPPTALPPADAAGAAPPPADAALPPAADAAAPAFASSAAPSASLPDYALALKLAHRFFEAQRSGRLPASNRVAWRVSAHLADCVPGGYYDAGDYLTLSFPLTTSLAILGASVAMFRAGHAAARQLGPLRWGADYLAAAQLPNGSFVGQVGSPGADHAH
jgi:endoglucanase